MDKKDVRAFIKSEALKKFDGDFDILYNTVKNKHFAGSTLNERMNQSDSNGADDVNELAASVPLLNIAVPVNINEWDIENFTPLVAVVPSSFDEKTTKLVKAYDSKGKIHWLDAKQAPDFPVVVVGLNERVEVDKNGNLIQLNNYPDYSTTKVIPIDDGGYSGGGSGGGTGGGTTNCRVDGREEYLTGMWFSKVSYYEAWVRGAPEVRLIVKSPLLNFSSSPNDQTGISDGTFKPSKRSDVDKKTWILNNHLTHWDKAGFGHTLGFYFYEIDEGGTGQKVNLSLSYKLPGGGTATAKTDILIGSKDDNIGIKPVHFDSCPSEGYYSIGGGDAEFRFNLKNKL